MSMRLDQHVKLCMLSIFTVRVVLDYDMASTECVNHIVFHIEGLLPLGLTSIPGVAVPYAYSYYLL